MQTAMERLAELVADFRDEHGDDPEENEDTFAALMDIFEAAEEVVANDAPPPQSVDSTSGVGLTLFEPFPVVYDGITYDTAFNAFQAQKAPPDERSAFCNVDTPTATMLGRKCSIDVAAWDANRVTLMTNILRKQASQNNDFKERILEHAARSDIVHNSMIHDPFWGREMPGILKSLHEYFDKKRSKKRAKVAA